MATNLEQSNKGKMATNLSNMAANPRSGPVTNPKNNAMAAKPKTNKGAMHQRARTGAQRNRIYRNTQHCNRSMEQLVNTPSPIQSKSVRSRKYSTPEYNLLKQEQAKLNPLSPIEFNLHNETVQSEDLDATLVLGNPTSLFKSPNASQVGQNNSRLADVEVNTPLNQSKNASTYAQVVQTGVPIYHNSQTPGPSKEITEADLLYSSPEKATPTPNPIAVPVKWDGKGKGKGPAKTKMAANKMAAQAKAPKQDTKDKQSNRQIEQPQNNKLDTSSKTKSPKTTAPSQIDRKVKHKYHRLDLTLFIKSKSVALFNLSTSSLARALTTIHQGQCTIIRPNKEYIILHCSTLNQTAKFMEIEKLCGIPVQVEKHRQKSQTTQNVIKDNKRSTTATVKQHPQPSVYKAVLKLTGRLMPLEPQDISQKLQESGHRIIRNYQIGSYYNRHQKTIVLESDKPLSTPIKLGTRGPSIPLEQYKNKPRFCANCKHWGHYKSKCKYQSRCNNCGGSHRGKCRRNTPKCAQCLGNHLPTSPQCPATIREQNIIKSMNELNITYYQAKRNSQTHRTGSNKTNQNKKPISNTHTKKGTRLFKELNKFITDLDKVIDPKDTQTSELKLEFQRSLNHVKTQFFNLITINEPNKNG